MLKKLSFIIALKRRNRNSVFRKKYSHAICVEFGISRGMFNRLLADCITLGWIEDSGDYYRVISLTNILYEVYDETGLRYGDFKALKNNNTRFYDILDDLAQQLIKTNIYNPQKWIIDKKIELFSKDSRTVKKATKYFSKRDVKKQTSVDDIQKSLNTRVKTSARAVSKKLGVSINAANKILNKNSLFKREITFMWVRGVNQFDYLRIKEKFHNATVIITNTGYFKVCFGSTLILNEDFSFFPSLSPNQGYDSPLLLVCT